MTDRRTELRTLLDQRIAVLDGAWGTMLQGANLTPEDYRGDRFTDHTHDVTGDPDLLNLTRPDLILDVHRQYLAAGADITTTNTFTATSIGQADYGLQSLVREMNVRGRPAGPAGGRRGRRPVRRRLDRPAERHAVAVAAGRGPGVPGGRRSTQVRDTYAEQISALAEGGVDLLLIETIFDTLNCKAAIAAAREVAPELPLWISVTIVDLSGRTLSGQTVEAFWSSVEHAEPLVVGVNCSLGAAEMRPHVADLARFADTYVASPPERGPAERLRRLRRDAGRDRRAARASSPTPAWSTSSAAAAAPRPRTSPRSPRRSRDVRPREVAAPSEQTRFSGLEPFAIGPDTGFVMIGERTNVTGSARFRRLIESDDHQAAVDVALEQVRGGANLLDVNMDADLLDSERGDDHLPQPDRHRARGGPDPDHDRQLPLERCSRPD